MKNTLTLSAVLLSLSLAPAAFATDAQEQKQAEAKTAVTPEAAAPGATPTLTRSVLQALDMELRSELLANLRAGALGLLQAATPAVVETTLEAARGLTAR